ncbi:MAG TPA: MBOAT family O-acyltransferase [Bacteroidia bacterium]|nr:MBOAT family O-acyltransferase [Bacteroidia bacterium]
MLLLALILFALCGILFSSVAQNRSVIILVLSALAIASFSLPSLLFCFVIACINYLLIKNVSGKKWLFVTGLSFNLLGLAAFHYYEFLQEEWGIVPIVFGVTYLTLQFIDYICKVYFKHTTVPTNFIQYTAAALYAPKFFMGPIASLPDAEKEISIKQETNMYYGLNRILLGLFKKLVLAESLFIYVSSALDFKDNYPALTILSGACLYAMQLYFDFSGYCDIAIGASAMWGINLPENFNFPFRQKTWAAFWKSWHSSLTNLLWQYIFIPLYLFCSRKKINKQVAKAVCVFAVFSFMAFFNGIKSGFFISAYLYALFYLIELIFERKTGFISNLFIFLLFSIGLLFFRTPNYGDYSFLTERLTDINNLLPTDWLRLYFAPLASGGALQDYFNFSFTLILCFGFLFFERKIFSVFSQNKINYIMWFSLLLLLATWGVFTSGSRFIYMQF